VTRPQFHFTAESGWINDPHGITFHDGRYDVFYQYVPDSMIWSPNCHWGHAVGSDLFSLRHLPVALAPGDGDDGIWTGSLIQDGNEGATIFYTSTSAPDHGLGRIRTASANDDDWVQWDKGPVVAEAPHDLDVAVYRDPFVFRDGDQWRMFVGCGLRDGTAAAVGYRSGDLEVWTYEGIAASRSRDERSPVWTGSLWECPQLFELDGRHVLVTSVWDDDVLHHVAYGVGTFENGRFTADAWGQLTYGRSYYAPSFFRDADGRPCLTFWMRGVRDAAEGWSSAHSVPHVLSLDGTALVARPHPDLDAYLGPIVDSDADLGLAGDVRWEPRPGDELIVRSGDRQVLRLEVAGGSLVVFGGVDTWAMPHDGGAIRLVLDGPTAEISTGSGIIGSTISVVEAPLTVTASGEQPVVRALVRDDDSFSASVIR